MSVEHGPTSPVAPEEPAAAGVSIVMPAIEQAGPVEDNIFKYRAVAIDRIVNRELPTEFFDTIARKVDTIPEDEKEKFYSPEVKTYLSHPENVHELEQLLDDLGEGKIINELLAQQEREPNQRTLQALEMWSLMTNKAIRWDNTSHDLRAWEQIPEGRLGRQMLRVTEIVHFDAKALRLKHGLLSDEEKTHGNQYAEQCEALATSDDIPEVFQERLSEAASMFRAEAPRPAEVVPPTPEQPTAQSTAATAEVAPTAERKLRPIEKVFGQEVVNSEDIKAMSREVSRLLNEKDKPESLFQAARELAHLKRAGIGVTDPKKKENVSATLLGNLEAMRQKAPLEHAKYLGYLKYIGVLKEIDERDKERLQNETQHWFIYPHELDGEAAAKDRQALAELHMWQKYLKIQTEVPVEQQRELQEDLRFGVENNRSGAALLLTQGRMRYLNIPNELTDAEQDRAADAAAEALNSAAGRGQWPLFARLQNIINYAYDGVPLHSRDQQAIVAQLASARTDAQQQGRWEKFTAFFADSVGLSRRAEKIGPLVEDDVPQVLAGSAYTSDTTGAWTEAAGGSVLDTEPRPASATETVVASAADTVILEKPETLSTDIETSEEAISEPAAVESPTTLHELRTQSYAQLKNIEQRFLARREAPPLDAADQQAKELFDALYSQEDQDLPPGMWRGIEQSVRAEVAHSDKKTQQLVSRYAALLSNEIGYNQAQRGSWFDQWTSGSTQKLFARARIGGALGIFTMLGRRSEDNLRRAREATVEAMRRAANRTEQEPMMQAILRRFANEFELINVQELMRARTHNVAKGAVRRGYGRS